jgi:hypothetical protein
VLDEKAERGSGSPKLAGCASCALVAMLGLGGYLLWANFLPPPEPDVRVIPSPNGYDAAIDATYRFPNSPKDSALAAPEKADLAELRKLLAKDRLAIEALRNAVRQEWMLPQPADVLSDYPYLMWLREGSRRLVAEARVARAEGRPGDAARRGLDSAELGAKVGRGGPLLHNLVGSACTLAGIGQVERCLLSLSAKEARQAGHRLDRVLQQQPSEVEVFQEERRAALRSLQETLGGRAPPGGSATGASSLGSRLPAFWPRPWSYAEADRVLKAAVARAELPYRRRRPLPESKDPVSRVLSSSRTGAAFVLVRRDAIERLVRVELAVHEYRLRHGRCPPALGEVTAGLDARTTLDPFSGGLFVYRCQGDGWLLYSVGPDGKDNGGRPIPAPKLKEHAEGDIVAGKLWPQAEPAAPPS